MIFARILLKLPKSVPYFTRFVHETPRNTQPYFSRILFHSGHMLITDMFRGKKVKFWLIRLFRALYPKTLLCGQTCQQLLHRTNCLIVLNIIEGFLGKRQRLISQVCKYCLAKSTRLCSCLILMGLLRIHRRQTFIENRMS